jgi:hypothetical protein
MKIFVPLLVAAACVLSSTTTTAQASLPVLRRARMLAENNATTFKFAPVRSIQARVQGGKPVWDSTQNTFVFTFGNDFAEKYRGGMDTVNTASVEGALMYVQAEGIDYRSRGSTKGEWCAGRKNNMKYVVFYDVTIAQPEAAVAQFNAEYGPYSAMDGGQCTPASTTGTTNVFSQACNYFNGTNGEPRIGLYVGGEDRSTEPRAPYPNAMWFSFPNTCPLEKWGATKTDACRASTLPGLCPFGTAPDGTACTFSYKVLGWVPLDDLVGITTMKWSNDTTKAYSSFADFCADDKVEFKTEADGNLVSSIDFWKNPKTSTDNAARAKALVDLYNGVAAAKKAGTVTQLTDAEATNFVPIPTVAVLTAANPPCYKNVAACATATKGCKRDTYSQTCTVCDTAATECVVAPSGYQFPTPVKATPAPATQAPNTANGTTTSPTKSAASSLSLSVVSAVSVAMSVALSYLLA